MFLGLFGRKGGEDGFFYVGVDVNCGNLLFFLLYEFVKDGLLEIFDLLVFLLFGKVDFEVVVKMKDLLIVKVFINFVNSSDFLWEDFDKFRINF